MKKRSLAGMLALGFAGAMFIGASDASAAQVLTGNVDLKGADSTIVVENGVSLLKTKSATYELTEDSMIYSSKTLKLTLNNASPVNIDSIYTKNHLKIYGNGELNADAEGQFGINVGDDLVVDSKSKAVINSKGNEAGVRTSSQIEQHGGTINAYGKQYGVWVKNDVQTYTGAVLNANSEEKFGVYAGEDVFVRSGSKLTAEGELAGIFTGELIKADHEGSVITGISRNFNSGYAALHNSTTLRARCGGLVREVYQNPTIVVDKKDGIKVEDITQVGWHLKNAKNYTWTSDPAGLVELNNGRLYSKDGAPMNMTITGTRTTGFYAIVNKYVKEESVWLTYNGTHQVVFENAKTANEVTITVNYHIDIDGDGEYDQVSEPKEFKYEPGSPVSVIDLKEGHPFSDGVSFVTGTVTEDFIAEEDKEIDFYFEGDAE
ncbi:carbohydrate-binding domain-containing protein [Candidatus Enterococcus clewellii]|uniref:Uncharacterized protein n=1 Tax=Candidatus Enterococcus clewellii TaxID=1834193 RepID=A0A242K4Y4_9ENTE|nr:carbohydrate-binding domain-containing protein [Enterococcus sp. 9E7_DIV0242]OTP14588.1 hypothetical protein A5888_002689 [Enterococcus sp. 9E7_DIV0242]